MEWNVMIFDNHGLFSSIYINNLQLWRMFDILAYNVAVGSWKIGRRLQKYM